MKGTHEKEHTSVVKVVELIGSSPDRLGRSNRSRRGGQPVRPSGISRELM